MRDRKETYRKIWSRIEKTYFDGYMFYERGLQAALYEELRKTLPDVNVVVDPVWKVGGQDMRPDLVIVEKGQITDIFELKFWDGKLQNAKKDICKLLLYGANNETYPVRLNPNTTDWAEQLPVQDSCRLHFVVVARPDPQERAVWPQDLREEVRDLKDEEPELRNNTRVLSHWFGRIGGNTDESREWSIEFGIR